MGITVRLEDGKLLRGEPWRWVEFADGVRLEVYRPTPDELLKVGAKYQINGSRPNWSGYLEHVGRHWVRGLEGFKDQDGNDIPSTPELRCQLLRLVDGLFDFAVGKLREGEINAPGKEDSV